MRFSLLALLALCWTQSANAFDMTTQNVVLSGYVTSKVTSAPFDHKLIRAAQDDAAVRIAFGKVGNHFVGLRDGEGKLDCRHAAVAAG